MNDIITNVAKKHIIKSVYGENVEVSGVVSVLEFDEHTIVLKLADNVLTLKGEKFNIETLKLETGEVWISGCLYGLSYDKSREKVGLLKRLMK